MPIPALGRMMAFIDGENLVGRFQASLDSGLQAQQGIEHQRDVFVWHPSSIVPGVNVVSRAIFYTYVQGSAEDLEAAEDKIKALSFTNYSPSGMPIRMLGYLPHQLSPCVFRKRRGMKAKGVDIQLTVDVLTHCYRDNVDAVYLVSGDGDYLPVVKEAQRLGKQVVVAALSNGLSPVLRRSADSFIDLDLLYLKAAEAH